MLNLDAPPFNVASIAAEIYLILFVLVIVIGMLNILIAQVNDLYSHRKSRLTQAQIIVVHHE